jgi:hypothetical protein
MEFPTLTEIEKSESAILELAEASEQVLRNIPEYKFIMDENRISKMIIAGSVNKLYVKAKCIFNYCYASYFKDMYNDNEIKKYKAQGNYKKQWKRTLNIWKEKLTNKELFQAKLKITKEINKSNKESGKLTYMVSESGFLGILMFQGNDCILSTTFRKYITKYLKNIKKHHLDVFQQEKDRTMQEIENKLNKANEKIGVLEQKNFNNTNYINIHNNLSNLIDGIDNDILSTDMCELNIRRYNESKLTVNIFIADPCIIETKAKNSKKKIIENSDDSDEIDIIVNKTNNNNDDCKNDDVLIYSDEFDSYNLSRLKDRDINETLYFVLQKSTNIKKSKKLNYIHTIFFHNADHYKKFIEAICKNTPNKILKLKKNIFETTYANIIAFRQNTFIDLFMPDILSKIKENKEQFRSLKYETF